MKTPMIAAAVFCAVNAAAQLDASPFASLVARARSLPQVSKASVESLRRPLAQDALLFGREISSTGELGRAEGRIDFAADQTKTVVARYIEPGCTDPGPDGPGAECPRVDFAFPALAHRGDGTIRLNDEVVARFEDAQDWYFPAYYRKGAHPARFVIEPSFALNFRIAGRQAQSALARSGTAIAWPEPASRPSVGSSACEGGWDNGPVGDGVGGGPCASNPVPAPRPAPTTPSCTGYDNGPTGDGVGGGPCR